MLKKSLGLVLAGAAVAFVLPGCPTWVTGCDYGPCEEGDGAVVGDGTLPDGSKLDSGPDAEPPPGCTTPDEPLKNPEKCLVDSFGAYVSPTGDDANPGTKARPFRTLAKAIGAGQARVVVCEGTYSGSVEITRDLSLISGVDCAFSKAGAKAKIVATKPEHGLGIAKPASAVLVRDVEVEAIDGTSASPNSVAVVVNEVGSVKLVGVVATAKKGFDQPAGDSGVTGTVSNLAAIGGNINGNPATGLTAGAMKSCQCTIGGLTSGGGGGAASGDGQNGSPSIVGSGKGGTGAVACNPNGIGGNGATSDPATPAAKQTSLGAIQNGTWVAADGIAGADGKSGQGGGGGGGRDGTSAGGGGACGGCGGSGGKGGRGGGASIALFTVSSTLAMEATSLTAGPAGAGGAGGAGGTGATGGNAANGGASGCSSGEGGNGGDGGAAGGGAGGISYALVYRGTKPTRGAGTALAGGAGGKGGTNGAGVTDHGAAGTSGEELMVP